MRRLVLPLVAVVLAAGCGDTEPDAYKPAPTAQCLRQDGYQVTTDPADIHFVAANSEYGGLLARKPGNAVQIAFGRDGDDALGVAQGFRRFAPKKLRPHIDDVLRIQKNAVLLWTVTPPREEMEAVFDCLNG
jgi:hypothetical protein